MKMLTVQARASHANHDLALRKRKAQKIIAVLATRRDLAGSKLLEVGTGAGIIAAELAAVVGPRGHVESVDVTDERVVTDGYRFTRIAGTALPFSAAHFDIVVSNHVIEHVGDHRAQAHHLSEIRRVLDTAGLVYLAAPNKWRWMEPHFRLPLLSWLPLDVADRYVRATGKGSRYDCLPPSRATLIRLTREAGLVPEDITWEVLQRMAQNNELGGVSAFIRHFGYPAYRLGRAVIPTNILVARCA